MYTYFLAQHLNSDLSLESYTQWPKLHRPKAKHNTTQLQTPPWPITNTISSKITTTTTTVLTASPSPNAPPPPPPQPPPIPTHPPLQDSTLSTQFTPSSSSSSSTPSKHCLSSLPSFTSNSKPIAASAWAQSQSPWVTWTFGRRRQQPTTWRRLICCAFFELQLWDFKKNFVALISVWVLWKWRKMERNWNLSIVYFVC